MAYDVERNADIFFKDVPDGANSLRMGQLAPGAAPLLYVGGNCSIVGFDRTGNEAFWTVVSNSFIVYIFCHLA